jgi:hypothetical protein
MLRMPRAPELLSRGLCILRVAQPEERRHIEEQVNGNYDQAGDYK